MGHRVVLSVCVSVSVCLSVCLLFAALNLLFTDLVRLFGQQAPKTLWSLPPSPWDLDDRACHLTQPFMWELGI